MKWYEVKEQSAGEKRLIITWGIYKIFGEKGLYFIAVIVAFFTFIFNKKVRNFSKKYLEVVQKYTGIKPNLFNVFKHIISYANSLADKIIVFSGNFNSQNLIFHDENQKNEMYETINRKNGAFFICSHIGNIEVLQSLWADKNSEIRANIFLSKAQSQIFNRFLNTIKVDFPMKTFLVEDIGFETGIELKDNLENGEIVFIAGDRLSQNSGEKTIESKLFERKILLPQGTFKLAQLMGVPIYFISAVKIDKKYKIYLQKVEFSENIAQDYTRFMEKMTLIAPYQFYHFYDFFE